jgi:hypothetical protein
MGSKTKLKVFQAIVGLDPIDVMHCLVCPEWPPKRFGHHQAVLRDISTRSRIGTAR